MADSKITALTALAEAPATGDYFVIVDVSDTTMSASGTNKKIAASYVVGGGVLTFGASSVGINRTPSFLLDMLNTDSGTNNYSSVVRLQRTSTGDMVDGFGTGFVFAIEDVSSGAQNIAGFGAIRDGADNSGTLQFRTATAGSNNTKMTIRSDGDVGINIEDPVAKLHVVSDNAAAARGILIDGDGESGDIPFAIRINTTPASAADGDTKILVDYRGYLGILKSSPAVPLDVTGAAAISTSLTTPIVYGSSVANGDLILEATSNATKTSAYIIMQPNGGGGVGIGTNAPVNPLHIVDSSTGGANFSLECTDTGGARYLWSSSGSASAPGAGALEIFKAGQSAPNRLVLTYSSSNVRLGVGVTNPSSTLDIGGAGVFSGSISAASDTNTTSYLGRAAIGYNGTTSDLATFAHVDMNSSANYAFAQNASGSTRINCASGQSIIWLIADSIQYYLDSSAFYPFADNSKNCGSISNRWAAVYAANGTIQTSDAREKTDIMATDLGLGFINALRPISYRWRKGEDHRRHYGLVAQEVKQVLDAAGAEFGGYEEGEKLGLNYAQFVAPLIRAVQELSAQVAELRGEYAGISG